MRPSAALATSRAASGRGYRYERKRKRTVYRRSRRGHSSIRLPPSFVLPAFNHRGKTVKVLSTEQQQGRHKHLVCFAQRPLNGFVPDMSCPKSGYWLGSNTSQSSTNTTAKTVLRTRILGCGASCSILEVDTFTFASILVLYKYVI
jgi:hypothetical protein